MNSLMRDICVRVKMVSTATTAAHNVVGRHCQRVNHGMATGSPCADLPPPWGGSAGSNFARISCVLGRTHTPAQRMMMSVSAVPALKLEVKPNPLPPAIELSMRPAVAKLDARKNTQ